MQSAVAIPSLAEPGQRGHDAIAHEVLFLLADARDMGLMHEDIPALLEYRAPRAGGPGAARNGSPRTSWRLSTGQAAKPCRRMTTTTGRCRPTRRTNGTKSRSRTPTSAVSIAVYGLAPESVWAEVRARLCASRPRDQSSLSTLSRTSCTAMPTSSSDASRKSRTNARVRRIAVSAHLGGVAATDAAERFWRLQDRLQDRLGWRWSQARGLSGGQASLGGKWPVLWKCVSAACQRRTSGPSSGSSCASFGDDPRNVCSDGSLPAR